MVEEDIRPSYHAVIGDANLARTLWFKWDTVYAFLASWVVDAVSNRRFYYYT